ncbi:hypothetical protein MRX96_020855 [Rhipicephalus microplus]
MLFKTEMRSLDLGGIKVLVMSRAEHFQRPSRRPSHTLLQVHASNDVRDWKKSARERNSAPMDLWELNLRSGREKNVLSADGRNAEAEMAVARKKPLSPSVFSNCPGRSRVKRSPFSPTAARGDPCFRRLTGPRPKWTLTQLGEPQIWTLGVQEECEAVEFGHDKARLQLRVRP